MQNLSTKTDRIYGVDLLRVILSFCVIVLHVMHYGGLRTQADSANPGFYVLWSLGILIDCTVNCFAILSGFILYSQNFKYTNIVRIYLTVLYYGVLITAAFSIFSPELVTDIDWFSAVCPVSQDEFWYFTAYFGLFLLIPILTQGMRAISNKQADILAVGIVIVFSVLPTVTGTDPFHLQNGYSALWLGVMFIIGTYLRKRFESFSRKRGVWIAIYAGSMVLTCAGVVLSILFPSFQGMRLIEYVSPTIVLAAVAVVLLFASLSVPRAVGRFLNLAAPLTFGIYLLHEHPLVRKNLIMDKFTDILSWPTLLQIGAVLGIAIAIWLIGFGLEYIRKQLFRLVRVDGTLHWIVNKFFEKSKM